MALDDTLDESGSDSVDDAGDQGGGDEGGHDDSGNDRYITREELEQHNERMNQTIERMGQTIAQSLRQPVIQADPDDLGEITDDDDENTKIAKMVSKQMKPIRQGLRQLQQSGMSTITKLTDRQVMPNLPYYSRFKKEVDAELSRLDPIVRAQPEAVEYAYKLVIADHLDEITAEKIQESERQRLKGATPKGPGGRGRTLDVSTRADGLFTPQDIGWSEDQIAEVEGRGGLDAYARRSSGGRFKDFQDLAKARLKQLGKYKEPVTKK